MGPKDCCRPGIDFDGIPHATSPHQWECDAPSISSADQFWNFDLAGFAEHHGPGRCERGKVDLFRGVAGLHHKLALTRDVRPHKMKASTMKLGSHLQPAQADLGDKARGRPSALQFPVTRAVTGRCRRQRAILRGARGPRAHVLQRIQTWGPVARAPEKDVARKRKCVRGNPVGSCFRASGIESIGPTDVETPFVP